MEQVRQRYMQTVSWAGRLLLCMLLAACTLPANNPKELDKVWEYAYVYFPAHPSEPVRVYEADYKKYAAEQEGQKPLPAVVFLHGCEGFRPTYWEANFPRALAQAGYVVFVPDSFARPDRKPACHYIRWNTLVLRHAEVDEARKRLQDIAWVDQRNLFLAGHSEGGMAIATYDGPAFNAYYLSGWTCASREESLNPLHMPKDSPVLAVLGDKDEYYPGNNGVRHCGDRMKGRPNARSIVAPGLDHGGVPRDPAMLRMLTQFFDQNRVPPVSAP